MSFIRKATLIMSRRSAASSTGRKEFFGSPVERKAPNGSEGPSPVTLRSSLPRPLAGPGKTLSERPNRSRSASRIRAPAVLSPEAPSSAENQSNSAQALAARKSPILTAPSHPKGAAPERKGSLIVPSLRISGQKTLNPSAAPFVPASLASATPEHSATGLAVFEEAPASVTFPLSDPVPNSQVTISTGTAAPHGSSAVSAAPEPGSPELLVSKKRSRKTSRPAVPMPETGTLLTSDYPMSVCNKAGAASKTASGFREPHALATQNFSRKSKPQSFVPIKVSRAEFELMAEADRPLFEAVSSDSDESNHSANLSEKLEPVESQKKKRVARKLAKVARKAPSSASGRQDDTTQYQSEGEALDEKHRVLLAIRVSANDGSCLFDSLAKGLGHILSHDVGAFSAHLCRSAKEAIHALVDPALMRSAICDHLEGPFADKTLSCLFNMSPRQTVMADYVEGGQPLIDADWIPPTNIQPAPSAQRVSNYQEYIRAMRKPRAHGDEICLAASVDLLGLRHIVFDTRGHTTLGVFSERETSLSFDHHPEQDRTESRTSGDHACQRRLSSRMPLFLLRTDDHFDWMHCQSDVWHCPNDDSIEMIVAETREPVTEIKNPAGFSACMQPFDRELHCVTTVDPLLRPLPRQSIIQAEVRRRGRREVIAHLTQELEIPDELAQAAVNYYEQAFEMQGANSHVSMRCISALQNICKALGEGTDLLELSDVHPDIPKEREQFRLPSHQRTPFTDAVRALMLCTNVSEKTAAETLWTRMQQLKDDSPLGEPLRLACQDIKSAGAHSSAEVVNKSRPLRPADSSTVHTLSDSRAKFIASHLGNGSRVMTASEIVDASKNKRREMYTDATASPTSLETEKYWRHHQGQTLLTPRGCMPMAKYQQLIHHKSCDALHQEACDAARKARQVQHVNSDHTTPPARPEQVQTPQVCQIQEEATASEPCTPTNPIASSFCIKGADGGTPASASRPTSFASLLADEAIKPKAPQQLASAFRDTPSLPWHSSPAVRLAQDREKLKANEGQINIMVDTGILPSNSVIWKQGNEGDGAGFNYHAFSGVKASWEQANSDKKKSYHTFKSFIDARFISTICNYISLDRSHYDAITDSELLQLIEENLKPVDSTIYFMKVGRLRISNDPAGGSLSQRYREFADKFLATVNEAREAGTPLAEEAVKAAFKTACNDNLLLKMWIGAECWTTIQAVHQRIFKKLQSYEALDLCKTLSETPANSATVASAGRNPSQSQTSAQPPAVRQHYSPEQRREYHLAQQQARAAEEQKRQQNFLQQNQLQQLNQQQIMANVVQNSVDSAFQRMNQLPPSTHIQMQQPTPPTNRQVAMNAVQPPNQTHPGLDSRGPNWHMQGSHLSCRTNPCNATLFCQGCGTHGHHSAECRRRNHPHWNGQGYYSDRYPGMSSLPYQGPPRPHQQLSQHSSAQPTPQPQQSTQQTRIAPPQAAPNPLSSFPTPHKLNNVQRTSMPPSPAVHVNVSTQSSTNGINEA